MAQVGILHRPAAGVRPQHLAGAVVLAGAFALAVPMAQLDGPTGALWFLGMAAGFTLQRTRLCFASAFRDLFLFGSGRMLKAILLGIAVATTGFAAIMRDLVPNPALGLFPSEAHILPVGLSTVIAGLLFGVGMVVAGGCVSGSLYRAAEGYVASWVALAGVVVGLGFISQTWNWWWTNLISAQPKLWLPSIAGLGYAGAIALTFAALLGLYLFVEWWEARAGLVVPERPQAAPTADTFGGRLRASWNTVFRRGWPAAIGAGVIGLISVVMYTVHMPFGVTGELGRWANAGMTALGAAPPEALGLSDLGGCTGRAEGTGIFGHSFSVTVGLVAGALVAALFSSEFKIRFPRRGVRYAQSLAGGTLMGVGAGLGIGCTIGAFFSSISSLSVSGWLFGAALAGGAFIGTQVIKRIP